MAGELKISYAAFRTLYTIILNASGQVWNTNSFIFETYNTANLSFYAISMTQQGTGSSIYIGNFPSTIPAGVYDFVGKQQLGGAPAESDPTIGSEDGFGWNGINRVSLSDLSTSGQVSQFAPVRIARGTMITPFKFYLVSQADHVTPFTSGICSGQINRDNGTFGALQSGAFTEEGLGFYRVQALTSGDLLCNAASLVFTAAGISGGNSDPRPFTLITQRTSGV